MTKVIKVRFYEETKKRLSEKSYFYLVDSDTKYSTSKDARDIFDFIKTCHYNHCLCKIVNTKLYNYRGSKIVIESILPYRAPYLAEVQLKEITFTGEWLPSSLVSELDYAPYDSKEDTMEKKVNFSPVGTIVYQCQNGEWVELGRVEPGQVNTVELNQCFSGEDDIAYDINRTTSNLTVSDTTDNSRLNQFSCLSQLNNAYTTNSLHINNSTISNVVRANDDARKEKTTMFENIFKNVKFGKATNVRMSIYGPAFYSKTNKEWIAFNNGDLTNVDGMTLEGESFCYMMPVAHDKVMIGDFILHNDTWGRVNYIDEATLSVEMPETHELVNVLPMKNIFGFNFYTKLVSLIDMTNFGASAETPFGMLPMVMMMNNATGAKGTMESMLPMLLMANGGKIDMDNPMMLMALCGGQSNDMMMGLMLSQAMNKTKN
jgi:hypothetical protein